MTNLFVGNLSFDATSEDLESAFAQFGTVERVQIMKDRDTGQPRGFAFVEMTDRGAAEAAIQGLNGTEFRGRAMNVNEARPKSESSGGFNRGPGGSGNGFKRGVGSGRGSRW